MMSQLILWLWPTVLLPFVSCNPLNSSDYWEEESSLDERRVTFPKSSVRSDLDICQIFCTEDSDCRGRNRVCDRSTESCVCAKGFTWNSANCHDLGMIDMTCVRDRSEQWEACERDKDCVDKLTCIPSAHNHRIKTCQPAGVRLGDQCVDGGQCPSNSVCQSVHGDPTELRCRCMPEFTKVDSRCVREGEPDDTSGELICLSFSLTQLTTNSCC